MAAAAGRVAAAGAAKSLPEHLKKKYGLAFTGMLLISTVLIATCVYQASLWSGIQAEGYQESAILRGEAAAQERLGNRMVLVDVDLILAWIEAVSDNDTVRAQNIEERFPERLRPAFNAWLNTSTPGNSVPPGTPFDFPEYAPEPFAEALRLHNESEAAFQRANDANQVADDYVLATILLASVLFLAGIHQNWEMGPRTAVATLCVTVGIFSVALAIFVYLPKSFGF